MNEEREENQAIIEMKVFWLWYGKAATNKAAGNGMASIRQPNYLQRRRPAAAMKKRRRLWRKSINGIEQMARKNSSGDNKPCGAKA